MNTTAVVTSPGLNMRAEPTTRAARVAVLDHDAALVVIGTAPRGWLRVRAGGKVGYVHGDFVRLIAPVPDAPPAAAPAEVPVPQAAEPPFDWPAVAICAVVVAAAILALFLV